jgi:glycosyltransferase involved in cell wall biosynthesis
MSLNTVLAYHVHDPNQSFVRTDITQLAKRCKRILLFTSIEPCEELRALQNVEVVWPAMDWSRYRPLQLLIAYAPNIIGIYVSELIATRRWIPIIPAIKRLLTNIFRAREAVRICRAHGVPDAVHYSFWFFDCIFLSWLRRMERVRLTIARTHRGDLYEVGNDIRISSKFRHYVFRGLDAVYSVSDDGTHYLHERYPDHKARIRTVYLGTLDHGMGPQRDAAGPMVIVSCAKIDERKRVHLIAHALERVNGTSVRWVHFGGMANPDSDPSVGQLLRSVTRLKARPNIEVHLMGHLDNRTMMEWYANNAVDLFVSMSSSEGLPVSMMEAISFGIPVLSTDVGGCREIVNERTGMLIPLDTSAQETAQLLEGFAQSRFVTYPARSDVRAFWQERFSAENNYADLLTHLGRPQLV